MKKFLELVTDPLWIFSAVFVGITINIISAFAKDGIDLFSKKISEGAKRKSALREAYADQMAAALRGRLEERIHMQFLQLKAILRAPFLEEWERLHWELE